MLGADKELGHPNMDVDWLLPIRKLQRFSTSPKKEHLSINQIFVIFDFHGFNLVGLALGVFELIFRRRGFGP